MKGLPFFSVTSGLVSSVLLLQGESLFKGVPIVQLTQNVAIGCVSGFQWCLFFQYAVSIHCYWHISGPPHDISSRIVTVINTVSVAAGVAAAVYTFRCLRCSSWFTERVVRWCQTWLFPEYRPFIYKSPLYSKRALQETRRKSTICIEATTRRIWSQMCVNTLLISSSGQCLRPVCQELTSFACCGFCSELCWSIWTVSRCSIVFDHRYCIQFSVPQ